jgi:hypothetical protein
MWKQWPDFFVELFVLRAIDHHRLRRYPRKLSHLVRALLRSYAMHTADILRLFDDGYLTRQFESGDDPHAEAALPAASLEFLLELCRKISAKRVFEFGSGRSTQEFLGAGYSVFSLEDSSFWLSKTVESLGGDGARLHESAVSMLKTRMVGGFPVLGWRIDKELKEQLGRADLILVDSPHFTPFREATLCASLQYGPQALTVLDDTRIPTVSRFCDRLANQNPQLLHKRVAVGHGFDLFFRTDPLRPLVCGVGFYETLKGWRRYFQGRAFYRALEKP